VSPSFLDQYIMAARAMAKEAVGTPVPDAQGAHPAGSGRRRVASAWRAGWRDGAVPGAIRGDYEIRTTGNPALFTIDGHTVDTRGRTHLTAGARRRQAATVWSSEALFGFVPGAADGRREHRRGHSWRSA
jgi:hypothetical protein